MTDEFMHLGQNSVIYQPTLFLRPEKIFIGNNSRIDSFCKFEGGEGIVIGDHVHIASFCHVGVGGGKVIMEDGSALASHVVVISGSNDPDAVSCSAVARPEDIRVTRSITRICKNAILFSCAVVLPGVTIGEGARIAAGAVVTQDVGPFETWAGVPAVFKRRDMEKWRASK